MKKRLLTFAIIPLLALTACGQNYGKELTKEDGEKEILKITAEQEKETFKKPALSCLTINEAVNMKGKQKDEPFNESIRAKIYIESNTDDIYFHTITDETMKSSPVQSGESSNYTTYSENWIFVKDNKGYNLTSQEGKKTYKEYDLDNSSESISFQFAYGLTAALMTGYSDEQGMTTISALILASIITSGAEAIGLENSKDLETVEQGKYYSKGDGNLTRVTDVVQDNKKVRTNDGPQLDFTAKITSTINNYLFANETVTGTAKGKNASLKSEYTGTVSLTVKGSYKDSYNLPSLEGFTKETSSVA